MTEATLVWNRTDAPQLLHGTARVEKDDIYRFSPVGGERPAAGDKVILWLEQEEHTKLLARVEAVEGGELVLKATAEPKLRRYYPRMDTAVALVYRVIDLGPAGNDYSKRQAAALKKWWQPASQEVNLSADGLAFLSEVAVPMGARLNMKLRLPDGPGGDYRVVGDVVRSKPETTDEGEVQHRLAVNLTWMSTRTHKALVDYTAKLQDEALEQLEPRELTGKQS